MIKRIILENFQSHAHSEIVVNGNMNAIIGVSDSGKSAIRRAIQAVTKRAPFYLKYGETSGSVTIEFDDCKVSRIYKKTKTTKCHSCKEKLGENTRVCQECGTLIPDKPASDVFYVDGETYDKFGTQLPPMITEKLRMCEVMFGDFATNISIQTQFEDMFFIGNSFNGSARNKMIMGLVPDSERVDTLIKDLNSEKNELRNSIKYMDKEHEENKTKIELVKRDIEDLTKQYENIQTIEGKLIALKAEMEAINKYGELLKSTQKIPVIKSFLDKNVETLSKALTFTNKLEVKMEKFEAIKEQKVKISTLKIKDVELPSSESLTECVGLHELIKQHQDKINTIIAIKNDILALKLFRAEIPAFSGEKVSALVTNIEDMLTKAASLKRVTEEHEKLKKEVDGILKEKKTLEKTKDVLQNKFRVEHSELICPHRNDVYADECLIKFVK